VSVSENEIFDTHYIIKFWLKSLRERQRSGDVGVDGMIILKWIFHSVRRSGLHSPTSEQGPEISSSEHGNETWGSIKARNFLTKSENLSFSKIILLHPVINLR
jgi:hypothetical protein